MHNTTFSALNLVMETGIGRILRDIFIIFLLLTIITIFEALYYFTLSELKHKDTLNFLLRKCFKHIVNSYGALTKFIF